MNASAQLSPCAYPDNFAVYACPDLDDNSHLLTLGVVKGHPTGTKQKQSVKLTTHALGIFTDMLSKHGNIFLALDADKKSETAITEQVAEYRQHHELPPVNTVIATRGRIKGINHAGECSLAILTGKKTEEAVKPG